MQGLDFQRIIDLIPYPVAIVKDNGTIMKINKQYEIFSYYSKEEIEGLMNYENLVCEHNLQEVKLYHKLRSSNLHSPKAYRWKYKCKNGELKDIFVLVSKIPNSDIRFVIIIDKVFLNDFPGLLEKQSYVYELFFKNTASIMFLIDPNTGEFVDINPAAESYYGYTRDKFLLMKIWDTSLEKEEHIRETMYRMINNPGRTSEESKQRLSNGIIRQVEIQGTPILIDDKLVLFIILNDITDKKLLEERLNKKINSIVKALTKIIELRDPYTAGHQENVAKLALAIGSEMNLSGERLKILEIAALLHDIGKIELPAEILSKPSKLTEIEFSLIKEHSRRGYEILKEAEFDAPVAEFVLQHHEKMDGTGYPFGLKGDEINLESRILAVADVVEAIFSHRPYRPALGIEVALEEITINKKIKYDEKVVEACLKLFKEKGFDL